MKSFIILLFLTYTIFSQTSGTFTDERDGNTYKWVKIGDQIWMAEDLRYFEEYDPKKKTRVGDKEVADTNTVTYSWIKIMDPKITRRYNTTDYIDVNPYNKHIKVLENENGELIKNSNDSSYKHKGQESSFSESGKLKSGFYFYIYPRKKRAYWDDSISRNKFKNPTKISSQHQGVCPKNWHIPSPKELKDLLLFINDKGNEGKHLKTDFDSKFSYTRKSGNREVSLEGKGWNTYGFSLALSDEYHTTKGIQYGSLIYSTSRNFNELYIGYMPYGGSLDTPKRARLRCIKNQY